MAKFDKPNAMHLGYIKYLEDQKRLKDAKVKPLSSAARQRVGDGRYNAHNN